MLTSMELGALALLAMLIVVVVAGVVGVLKDRLVKVAPNPLLLTNGARRARAEAMHRYFHDVGDSTTG